MANLSEPEDIIVEFLRANVTEVTRVGLSNRQSNDTQTFSATASQTEFTITDNSSVVCINEVTKNGSKLYKYIDYDIDTDNAKVTLDTGATLGDSLVIDYDYSSTWIYPDKPRDDLTKASYPRISVVPLTESQTQRGISDDYYYFNYTMQIDVLAYKEQLCTIDSETKEGQEVVNHIARDILTQIKTKWRDEMRTKLFNFNIIANNPAPFNESQNQFRRIIEISFDGEDR
jgi:hypothetical protein